MKTILVSIILAVFASPTAQAEETTGTFGASAGGQRTTGPEDAIQASSRAELDESVESEEVQEEDSFLLNYTNILYGPALENSTSFQPTPEGKPDETRPVFMKNFVSATYGINDIWAVTATAFWLHRPVLGQEFTLQDPFVRVSNASVFSADWGVNLYSDLRVIPGVTDGSRQVDRLFGVQNFSYLSYQPGFTSSWILALRASALYQAHGRQGFGNDAELYLAPEVNYRFNDKLALTLLYEMGASHSFGDDATYFTNDGTDLQPGIEWNPTPDLIINPYLNLLTGKKVTLATTSVGMFFSWTFL